jgi:hypothetical protein
LRKEGRIIDDYEEEIIICTTAAATDVVVTVVEFLVGSGSLQFPSFFV